MESLLGIPRQHLTANCQSITNAHLARRIEKSDVGPISVVGHVLAIESLKRIFAKVHAEKPDLNRVVGTAGMLCCRLIRGSSFTPSNHSWGTAIDLKIDGILVPLGSEHTLSGLLALDHYFHEEDWYWGAGFSRPDSMHFEVAEETICKWAASNSL